MNRKKGETTWNQKKHETKSNQVRNWIVRITYSSFVSSLGQRSLIRCSDEPKHSDNHLRSSQNQIYTLEIRVCRRSMFTSTSDFFSSLAHCFGQKSKNKIECSDVIRWVVKIFMNILFHSNATINRIYSWPFFVTMSWHLTLRFAGQIS